MKKTIGIIGGLSPESTSVYYETIIKEYNKLTGGQDYPEILIYSVDFQRYTDFFVAGRWEEIGVEMAGIFEKMRSVGVDFGLISSNTPHRALEYVVSNTKLPIISIVDVTADEVVKSGIKTVGLLGTKFTMKEDFFKDGLKKKGLDAIVPGKEDLVEVDWIIYDELVKGIITDESRKKYIEIIERLKDSGAGGVILGCTEIPLLIGKNDIDIPIFNTTEIHAKAALMRAIG